MLPTNGELVQTSGSCSAIAAHYRSACVSQAGARIVHALAFPFQAFVALGGCFFRGAAVVGDLADTLAGFFCLGAVLVIGLALGPGVCRIGDQCQANDKGAGEQGVVAFAWCGHGVRGG